MIEVVNKWLWTRSSTLNHFIPICYFTKPFPMCWSYKFIIYHQIFIGLQCYRTPQPLKLGCYSETLLPYLFPWHHPQSSKTSEAKGQMNMAVAEFSRVALPFLSKKREYCKGKEARGIDFQISKCHWDPSYYTCWTGSISGLAERNLYTRSCPICWCPLSPLPPGPQAACPPLYLPRPHSL